MLSLKEIKAQNEWESYLSGSRYQSFLQSWRWTAFQEGLGVEAFRYGIYEGKNLVGLIFLIEESSRFGKSLYSPRGPIIDWDDLELVENVLRLIAESFENQKHIFIRLDPAIGKDDLKVIKVFETIGYQQAVMPAQAENPWILEINGREDQELLQWMRAHGRRKKFGNFLSKARRSGVEIKFAETEEEVRLFGDLITRLGERKDLSFHSADYFIKMKECLEGEVLIPIAYIDGEPVAGAVVTAYGNEAAYIYGASLPETGQTHATHLLHWETIRKARELGIQRYNFWGVLTDEDYTPENPGYGYSNFKRSFGGFIEPLIKPMDLVYKKIPYSLYRFQQKKRLSVLKQKGVL